MTIIIFGDNVKLSFRTTVTLSLSTWLDSAYFCSHRHDVCCYINDPFNMENAFYFVVYLKAGVTIQLLEFT